MAAIEHSLNRREMDIMREVYREWLAEDINCSWAELTDCFRQCDLNNLAYSIEQHFGPPSPQKIPVLTSLHTLHNLETPGYTHGVPGKARAHAARKMLSMRYRHSLCRDGTDARIT